ncbi:MAG: 50S ribosomal protein L3 [Candidatus Njordarchaeales archaeon]
MPKYHAPRRGSLGFVRKRASRIYPRVSTWPKIDEVVPLGFPAYKVGMVSVQELYERPGSLFHGIKRMIAATVLEAPPIRVMGVRVYKLTAYGYQTIGEIWTPDITDFERKYLGRKVTLPKKETLSEEAVNERKEKFLEMAKMGEIDRVRLIIRTRPELTGIGKKKPEVMEIQVGGPVLDALQYALDKLGKEISVTDVLKPGQLVDIIGVTKGKGFQGVVKRFGVKILPPKTKKEKRAVGSLGPWTPGRVAWTVPRYGQLGFFKRTEYNKQILAIITGDEIEKLNPKSGWMHYGVIRNPAVIIRGSTFGPPKRMIFLRYAIRPSFQPREPKIFAIYYSKEQLPITIS